MRATEVLRRAQAAGVVITVDGGDLVVQAKTRPPADVLSALSIHKPALMALLTGQPAEWDAAEYHAYFDERAAIYESDGSLSRAEAEQRAFDDTVRQWLAIHPPPPWEAWRGCAQCLDDDQNGNPLLPFLTRGGHTWVHDQCWSRWHAHRWGDAVCALKLMGVGPSPAEASEP